MKPTVAVLYGDAGSAALIDALKHWRKDHAPQAAYETLLTEFIKTVKVESELRAGGTASIFVRIIARRRADHDSYYYEATVTGGELRLESITG